MKKIGLLLAFFAVFQVVSLEAQLAGKRWFTEVSAGGGKIYGPALMEKFDLRKTLTLELGFMLTDNIGVIPVAVSFDRFSGFEGSWGDEIYSSVVEYRRRAHETSPYTEISWSPLSPPDSIHATRFWMKSFSYSPGLLFILPASTGLRGYARLGAIYNSNRLYFENNITGDIKYGSGLIGPHKQSSRNPGFYLGGGIEYVIGRRYALNLYGSYTQIFTGRKGGNPEIDSLDDLEFYYAGNEGLKLASYPGSRDTKYFQFRGGIKTYFGL